MKTPSFSDRPFGISRIQFSLKSLIVVLSLALSSVATAQDIITTSVTTARSYSGTIGSYGVRMNLSVNSGLATGEFSFKNGGPSIQVAGTFEGDQLILKESYSKAVWGNHDNDDANIFKGEIRAKIDSKGNLSGTVKALTGDKDPYSLNLAKTFEANYADSTLKADYYNQNPQYKTNKVYTLEMKELYFIDLPYRKKLKYINSWYSYKALSYFNQNHFKSLNEAGDQKLEELGFQSGEELLRQSRKLPDPHFPYLYKNSYSVAYIDKHLLTVQSNVDVYNGAAHDFSLVTYKSYDLVTGDSIKLDSFLIPGAKYYLDSIGEICFRQQMGLGPDADLETSGYFWPDNRFHANTNYYFTVNGLCFVFNRFEIASFSAGIIKIVVPYSMLDPIINPAGPLGWVLKE